MYSYFLGPSVKISVLLFVHSILIGAFYFRGGASELLPVMAALIFLSGVYNPAAGLAIFIGLIPYFGFKVDFAGVAANIIWSMSFIAGVLIATVRSPLIFNNVLNGLIRDIFLLVLLVLTLLLSSIYLSPAPKISIPIMINIIGGVVVLFFVMVATCSVSDGPKYLVYGLIFSGALAVLLALISGSGSGLIGRLNLHEEGGGVRVISNAILMAFVGIFIIYSKRLGFNNGGHNLNVLGFGYVAICILIMILGLLLTVSRGVIITIVFILALVMLSSLLKSLSRGKIKVAVLYVLSLIFLVVGAIIFYLPSILEATGGMFNRLLYLDLTSDRSFQTRLELWAGSFAEFDAMNWLLGKGVGVYTLFSYRGLYEHSIWVSFLFAGGWVSIVIMLCLLFWWWRDSREFGTEGLFGVALLAVIFMFSTHGTINGMAFWVYFGVVGAIARFGKFRESRP